VGVIGEKLLTPSEALAAKERRAESAYEERWLASRNGKDTLPKVARMKLLSPFLSTGALSVISILKEREDLDYGRLLELEAESRRLAAGATDNDDNDNDDGSSGNAEVCAATMKQRVSFQRFQNAKLNLGDIFFKLQIRSVQTLQDLGFTAADITNDSGNFPLIQLMDLYGVNQKLLKDNLEFGMDEILRGNFSAQELSDAGFDFQTMYCDFGMTREDFLELPYTPREWHSLLKLDKKYLSNPLQIGNGELDLLRWSKEEVSEAFGLTAQEQLLMSPFPAKPKRERERNPDPEPEPEPEPEPKPKPKPEPEPRSDVPIFSLLRGRT
jgi:hypothetical protein